MRFDRRLGENQLLKIAVEQEEIEHSDGADEELPPLIQGRYVDSEDFHFICCVLIGCMFHAAAAAVAAVASMVTV